MCVREPTAVSGSSHPIAMPFRCAPTAMRNSIGSASSPSGPRSASILLNVSLRLWTISADIKAGERIVFRARQQIDLAKAYS